MGKKGLDINKDKEQRRNTRLGAIVAIIAVVGVVCSFLIKITIKILTVWQLKGIIYGYTQILFSCVLATCVIVFCDIVVYVIVDLKRYDVLDESYREYDKISDIKYLKVWRDFKIYMSMLGVLLILFIPIVGQTDGIERIGSYVISLTFIVLGLYLCINWLWNNERKTIQESIRNLLSDIVLWTIVAVCCWLVCILIVLKMNSASLIRVEYLDNGIVEITNSSSYDYKMNIEVQTGTGNVIYAKEIPEEELLTACEEVYISHEGNGSVDAGGARLDGERVYWKYDFNIKNAVRTEGEYCMLITVGENSKQVKLWNSFHMRASEFDFAVPVMEKEY